LWAGLGKPGRCEIMFIEWIDAPLHDEIVTNDWTISNMGREVEQIGQISGNPLV
jgi:hypothetical protein